MNSSIIKHRYMNQLFVYFKTKDQFGTSITIWTYLKLYKSGIEVFKKYPYFGVGNKNYGLKLVGIKKPIIQNIIAIVILIKSTLSFLQSMEY